MSVCFYHCFAKMPFGVDVHKDFPMLVFAELFQFWPRDPFKDTETVMADGIDMIQDGFSLFLIPHIPPSGDPIAIALAAQAGITSSSKPFLSKQTVSGEGTPLACCTEYMFGANANCWSAGVKSAPSGFVICASTVVTTPTAGDWVAAIVGLAINNVISLIRGKCLGDDFVTKACATWMFRYLSIIINDVKSKTGIDLAPCLPILYPLLKSGQVTKTAKKATQRWVDDFIADL